MAQYSPELIEQTISMFGSRTGKAISQEDARQAIENISGFFQVLIDWASAETGDTSENAPDRPAKADGVLQ